MDLTFLCVLAALGLLLIAVILLVVLLVRQGRLQRAQLDAHRQQADYLQSLGYELLDEISQQGQEHTAAQADSASRLQTTLTQLIQLQSTSVSASLTQLDARMENLRSVNDRQLNEMRRTVDEKLTESLDKRLNDSFALVSRKLEQVYKSLGEMQSLAVGVGDLKKVLTNVKTRGIWGEMQLSNLLSQMLAPGQYEENVAVIPTSSERVEFVLRLPGRGSEPVYLPIDSKFPQEDYLRLAEASQAGHAAAADEARKALILRLRQEAKRISTKYIAPPHTTDFAVMFLPVEALYAEAVQSPEVCESLQRDYRVMVAGPSTFSALLNALQMGFRTLAIEQRSSEVWQLLGTVKTDFDRFADVLEKTRHRLQQATESIDTAFTRTRTIQRHLSAVEDPGALPQDASLED